MSSRLEPTRVAPADLRKGDLIAWTNKMPVAHAVSPYQYTGGQLDGFASQSFICLNLANGMQILHRRTRRVTVWKRVKI